MNILYSAAESSISGANKSMCIVADYMMKEGHNVYVILPEHGSIEKELNERKIQYFIVKSYQWVQSSKDASIITDIKFIIKKILNYLSIYKIKQIIRKYDIDIIHNNSISSYVSMVAGEKLNRKVVCHFREFLEEDHGLRINKIFNHKKVINNTSAMIAISECIWDKFSKIYDKSKIRMIYNGIQVDEFIYNKEIFEKPIIYISVIGRVNEGKGQEELIKAIELLQKEQKYDIKLKVIGKNSSKYAQQLITYVKEKKLEDVIEFINETRHIQEYYKNSDIIVVSSRYEAFGRVTIESMLTSNLVIGANTAGTKELIKDNKYGILYEAGNYIDLKEKIEYCLNNKETCKNIVKISQKYAVESFNAEKNAKAILDLYLRIS